MKKRFIIVAGASLAAYVFCFAATFELLSSPVRDDAHGWLGPVLRRDPHVTDIGKVYYYESSDVTAYRVFKPLCRAWLFVNGF